MVAGARTPAHSLYLNLNEDDSFTGPLAPAPTLRPGPCPGTPLVGAFPPLVGVFPPLTGALPAYTHGVYTARVMVW